MLGVDAELTPGEVNLQLPGPRTTVPCFEAPAGSEVVVRGRKLIGSAMRAHGGAILQHGSILMDWNGRLQAGAMGLEEDSALRSQVTTLCDEVGRRVPRPDVEHAVVDAFTAEFAVELEEAPVSSAESAAEDGLERSFASLA